MAFDRVVVVKIDDRLLSYGDISRLSFGNAKNRLQSPRLHDTRELDTGVYVLSHLELRIAKRLKLTGLTGHDAQRSHFVLLFLDDPLQAFDLLFVELNLLCLGRLHLLRPFLLDVETHLQLVHEIVPARDLVRRGKPLLVERVNDERLAHRAVVLRAKRGDGGILRQELLPPLVPERCERAVRLRKLLLILEQRQSDVGVAQLDDDGIRRHRLSRTHRQCLDAAPGDCGNDLDMFRHERARRVHGAGHLAPLRHAEPQRAALDRRRRRLEPADCHRHGDDRQNPDGGEDVPLGFLRRIALDIQWNLLG